MRSPWPAEPPSDVGWSEIARLRFEARTNRSDTREPPMLALVACSALLAVGLDAPSISDTRQAYQEAKGRAGRSPEDQVRLALWCEAHGLTAERLHHLTLA